MSEQGEFSGLAMRSRIDADGRLTLVLERTAAVPPGLGQVTVRVEAAPVNPSDLGLLLGPTDPSSLRREETAEGPVVHGDVPPDRLAAVAGRLDQALPTGAEGAGIVVAAGDGAGHLLGRMVAGFPGGMYAQFRTLAASELLVLPPEVSPREAAACFINPLTALGMVETMRLEGHRALIHTAAASNLGHMLIRLCRAEDVQIVNIVRNEAQVALLRDQGALRVLNSGDADFDDRLADAVGETGASLAFDAVGGGPLAGRILHAMERGVGRHPQTYSAYGSKVHKQVYVYGALDTGPTVLERKMGMAWGVGGWLLPHFLDRVGPEAVQTLKARVVAGLSTIFASRYTHEITLDEALHPERIRAFLRKATGEKYLIRPNGV